jgi:hypothetical protein
MTVDDGKVSERFCRVGASALLAGSREMNISRVGQSAAAAPFRENTGAADCRRPSETRA